ncbi:NAD-dependent epimerase/dehydratase family protein [Pseudomonas sp. JS3066]|uniref:NAD-dependent epimerase/dehydratase family protein n=1 Tax=Pseudomonas sp. JS3066 TaxID=3090665 RepID=UPI002E7B8023|nr:NAD-dependent epimerase/dehydratase family protein [Pseudomonas sp. JS3066]WVK95011.1 NAD-dependent epimerase/dehydratase family protein [Pseudomonas sp. JS3066]
MTTMKVLVTGANGFVGTALCQRLAQDQHFVHGLVRETRTAIPEVTYHVGSLADHDVLRAALRGTDCVIHLAGRAHVMREDSHEPLAAFREVNRDATLSLAQIAKDEGVKRFVFISSIGVNGGETSGTAFSEKSPPAPHADYALSKLEAEDGLRAQLDESPMELVIIRPPLVYGVGAPGNFGRLLRLVSLGIPLPFGRISNHRSMVSLTNLVDFIILCSTHPKAAGELFLISDGCDISTPQMMRALARGMGRRQVFLPIPEVLLIAAARALGKESMYKQLCGSLQVDSAKARALLGWSPLSDTQDELERIGRFYVQGRF